MTFRVLVVTNDFPPRAGGIQSFVYGLVSRLPPESVVVYASAHPEAPAFDRTLPFPVVRDSRSMLLPTPAVRRRAIELLRAYECDRVCFGASFPLGLLASSLRSAGARRCVALTHGHEAGLVALPGMRSMLARIARENDVITVLGEFPRTRLARIASKNNLVELNPGVDSERFHPDRQAGETVRRRYGLAGRPVIVCVSRLMPRKGQDALIKALPDVRKSVPDAALLLVGDGPDRRRLGRLARRHGVTDAVVFTGEIPEADLSAHYAAGDVFAMPCRTRRAGFDVEGLGMVFLEAAAAGLPVIAGDSGGARDAVRHHRTGYLLNGRDQPTLTRHLADLLTDRARAIDMGETGRAWVGTAWNWATRTETFTRLLTGTHP